MATVAGAQAQNADSLAMERRIAVAASDVPFPEGARALLLGRLQQGMREDALHIIRFMDRRTGYAPAPWLSPRERLLVTTLAEPAALIRNRESLASMLARAKSAPAGLSPFDDMLYDRLRELLRQSAHEQLILVREQGGSLAEQEFAELLVNHLTTRGYRPRMTLNSRIETFAAANPDEPLAQIAEQSLITKYAQSQFGAAFNAGYTIGRPGGDLAGIFDLYWAPSLAGEFNYGPLVVTGSLLIGVAEAPSDFVAGGEQWSSGETSLLTAGLMAGYEIRSGRLGFIPSIGIALQSATGAHTANATEPARTGWRSGWLAEVGIGYRIPSDVGPHFDFRARIGHIVSGLASYDSALEGSISYLQIGFALVQRPWDEGP